MLRQFGRRPVSAVFSSGTFASLFERRFSAKIPIIEVSPFVAGCKEVQLSIAGEVDHAFREFGFAVITGHGAEDMAFDEAYDAAKRFFRSGAAEKRAFDLGLGYGYGGYVGSMEAGGQLTGEENTARRSDAVESLTCRGLQHLDPTANDQVNNHEPLFAQDMSDVPRADAIPAELAAPVVRLHEALFPLKQVLNTVTELCLGVEAGSFKDTFDPHRGGIRFAYYPELEERAFWAGQAEKPLGYGAHADSGGMVVLRLDRENPVGTEVFYKNEWLQVPYVPGGVVVNLGTVLSRLTGGRWQAAIHRAARANHHERLSTVYGVMVPDNELHLECLVGGSTTGTRKVRVKDYLDARVRMQRPEVDPKDRDLVDYVDQMSG